MIPSERLEHYRQRIERFNPSLNAVLDTRWPDADAEAQASDKRYEAGQPLSAIDGWCVAIKSNIAIKGLPFHAGIAAYSQDIAPNDAEVVRRLKQAGVVIIGTVNMHEGALGATTDNETFGRTHNPWGEGRTPGGSSGGSGAAVAAGLCDFALGSDTMGSVRIPSAYCGVQGLKPTTGLVPTSGVLDLSPSLDHVGPHARSVDALAQATAVLANTTISTEAMSFQGLQVGVWRGLTEVETQADVLEALERAVSLLREAGADTQTVEPEGYGYGKTRRAGLLVSEVEGYAIHAERLASNPDGFSNTFRGLLQWGYQQPQAKLEAAREHLATVQQQASKTFTDVDVVIAPTAPQVAFRFSDDVPADQADFTAWANIAGLPAISLFAGLTSNGLPTSVQLIGKPGTDEQLLSLARSLEELFGQPSWPPGFETALPGN